ncbi:MAG: site-2 protease family protein [Candidatus Thorarchaeota archaeon]|nr:site-2 protease family protein [Candidatus Thorarchaeota archaeon]
MEVLDAILIIVVIYVLVYIIGQAIGVDKLAEKGIDVSVPFFCMWKTERLNAFLTRMGKKFPKAFFNLGIIVAFGGMIVGFWMFGDNLLKFFIAPEQAGGIVPIIPGVTITGLPLVYMLIGLAITLVVHEFAHGLASSKDGIPIKGSGLVFMLVLFGGFVEPDEEIFETEASPQARMRLLAAGSYANLIWAAFFLVIMLNMGSILGVGFNAPDGAYVYGVQGGSPAEDTIAIGDVIIGLNDTDINTWYDVSLFMANTTTGEQLEVHTLEGSFMLTLGNATADSTRGYIGINGADYWEAKPGVDLFFDSMFAFHFQQIMTWTFIILFSVALFNLLPIPMLDGDKLLSNALSLKIKDEKKIKYIMWPARIAALLIVILSIALTFLTGKSLF